MPGFFCIMICLVKTKRTDKRISISSRPLIDIHRVSCFQTPPSLLRELNFHRQWALLAMATIEAVSTGNLSSASRPIVFTQFSVILPVLLRFLFICLSLSLRIWVLNHHILKLRPQCFDRAEFIADLNIQLSVKPTPSPIHHTAQLTAMTPSSDRFSLLILANTCSKL